MSGGALLWLGLGLACGFAAGWILNTRRTARAIHADQVRLAQLRQELADSLAVKADRDARIETLEAELELAPRRA